MKLNKILMVLAATAIVGCTSEDLNDFNAKQAPEDSRLIELNSDFALAGVGVDGAMTRTHWEQDAVSGALVNKFLPIYKAGGAPAGMLDANVDKLKQAVGLCWLGQVPGAEVYTNYQFYHFGWLNNDETEADYDCGTLYNGALYSDIDLTSGSVAGVAGQEAKTTNWDAASPNGVPNKARVGGVAAGADNLNYNSGVYKTENKAIFGGQYIVYYPFNPDFKEAGTIPAKAKTLFSWDPALTVKPWEAPELGDATFRYSAPVTIEGGDEAANFGLYNLSTLVRLRVVCPAGDANATDDIDQIVLYSPSEKLLKQANLAADKIVAGQKGADLYDGTEKGTKTITTNFTGATSLNVKATTTVSAYITVLPTTVPDLVALVHNKTKKTWATVEMGNTEFKAGGATALEINVASTDFAANFIAVDEASLTTALTEARLVATAANPATITVIGDIELKAKTLNAPIVTPVGTYNINAAADANITITGGDIIVPEGVTLNLNTNMDSKVRVLGTYCCSGAPAGGILNVAGGKISDLTMVPTEARVTPASYDALNPTVNFTGAAEIVAGKTVDVQAGNVKVNRPVVQKEGNFQIAEGAKLTVNGGVVPNNGNLSFLGTTVDNYGTIEVMKAGEFYMKNANGTSVWTDGQKMTNHETGKFIHNVDAVVGTAVQFMNQETGSEYRCRVDKQKALDDAYVQWTACSVIEMVSSGAITYDLGSVQQHTIWGSLKHVDIEVNNTGAQTTFQKNADGKQINIGNLTVLTPLDVDDQEGGTPKVQRELIVNGDMTVSANTNLKNSKKITVTKNLDINNGATLKYCGVVAGPPSTEIKNGLQVNENITVTGATFDASDPDAIQISCKNFSLVKGTAAATATFGNRTNGNTKKTMEVKGTINNGEGCTFTITPAGGANLLAWITCYKVEGEGTFAGTPTVIAPPTE